MRNFLVDKSIFTRYDGFIDMTKIFREDTAMMKKSTFTTSYFFYYYLPGYYYSVDSFCCEEQTSPISE